MSHSIVFKIYFTVAFLALAFTSRGQTLFDLLSSDETGITFNNIVTDEKSHNILLYSNYYGGAGVGIGDFNKDGLQDIFFAGNLVSDQLYLNQGEFKFIDASQSAGILKDDGWSSGVLVVDINNDGWDDIYVTRELYDEDPERRRNLLYVNQKDGTFAEMAGEVGLDSPERTRHAVFFDYNKDDLLDVFLLNQPPNPGNYSIYSGTELMKEEWAPRLYQQTPDFKFIDVTEKAGVLKPCFPNSATASDIDGDGYIDIYVSNDYDSPDFFYKNNGDGTFTNVIDSSHKHISYYSMGVDAADINNDGLLDVMTLDMVAEDNFRLKSNMSGMNPDQFWSLLDRGGHRQYMFNALHLNQGQQRFSDIAQLAGVASTDWSWSNLIADFNNDGWKDIHVTNGLLRDIRNTDAGKSFPEYVRKVSQEYVKTNPNAGDVDLLDILDLDEALSLIPSVALENYFFVNNGDLTFSKASKESGLDQKSFSNGSAYADLDNDGDLDLIVNNINEEAFVYRNNTKSNFLRVILDRDNLPVYGSKIEIYTEKGMQFYEFTNARGMYSTSENIAHFGLGDLSKVVLVKITWQDGKITNLKEIGANQVIKVSSISKIANEEMAKVPLEPYFDKIKNEEIGIDFTHVENNFDDYSKQVLLPHKMSQFGPAMASGDVDQDGLEDLFFGGAVGQPGFLYLQRPDGSFVRSIQEAIHSDSLHEDVDALFYDYDNDGDLDLYVVSGGNGFPPLNKFYQDRLYSNDGQGSFSKTNNILPAFRESGSVVKSADYDGDGDLDLFVGGRHQPWDYPAPAISRLLSYDNGHYIDVTKTHAADLIQLGLVTDGTWSDVDSDRDLDLIVVGEWMHPTFFVNNNGSLEKTSTTVDDENGWYYSIESCDVNNDNKPDYIVGNLGLNYKYKASKEEPFEVFYDDFDNNGNKDIVLSYYSYGEQYPLRGRSCSAEQIPEIKKKFESYDLFASSNLEQVYGTENLDQAYQAKATNFSSGVLINEGDLSFDFIAFPNEAQISSINDIVPIDINEDGNLDLIVSGNLHTSEIETTRNDAGVGSVLIGDGLGNFRSQKTRLLLDKDAKKMILLKTPKGMLLVTANNDSSPTIHRIK